MLKLFVSSHIIKMALLKPSSLKAILPTIFGIRAAAGGYPGHFNRAIKIGILSSARYS